MNLSSVQVDQINSGARNDRRALTTWPDNLLMHIHVHFLVLHSRGLSFAFVCLHFPLIETGDCCWKAHHSSWIWYFQAFAQSGEEGPQPSDWRGTSDQGQQLAFVFGIQVVQGALQLINLCVPGLTNICMIYLHFMF